MKYVVMLNYYLDKVKFLFVMEKVKEIFLIFVCIWGEYEFGMKYMLVLVNQEKLIECSLELLFVMKVVCEKGDIFDYLLVDFFFQKEECVKLEVEESIVIYYES